MRVAIIGSGFGLYGLLPAFNAIKGCEVVAICGKKSERLLNYCKSIGLTKIYTDWKEVLENEKLDAVAIAVVPQAQYEIAKAAIKKGLHVFAEKPLTANYQEAVELLTLAKKKKITTVVDFIFPEIEEWKKVKEILDKRTLGNLQHISATWDFLSYDIKNGITSWKTDAKQGGGALAFYASHVLYYIEYFAGEVKSAKSILTFGNVIKSRAETGVDMVLKFKNKITGTVHVSCNTPGFSKHQVTFVCERGTLVLDSSMGVTEHFTLTQYANSLTNKIELKKSSNQDGEDERVRVVKKLATRFVNGCRTSSQVVPSFKEGVRVQKLIEEIRKQKVDTI